MKTLAVLFSMLAATGAQADFDLWAPSEQAEFRSEVAVTDGEPVPPGQDIQPLVAITSSKDANKSLLHMMVDQATGKISGVYNLPDVNNREDNESQSNRVIWLNDIETKDGAIMLIRKGYKVLFLQGKLDEATQEGEFKIRFLRDAIFNSYRSCDFGVRKGDNGWYVENAYTGETVTTIKVVSHATGVTTIEGLCP